MTTAHIIALAVWLILTTAAATAFAITRHRYTWWAMVALCFPLAGVIWVLTLPARRSPPDVPTEDTAPGLEEETWPDPPPPIQLPKDHTTKEDRHVPPPPPDDADRDDELDWYRKRTDALRDD